MKQRVEVQVTEIAMNVTWAAEVLRSSASMYGPLRCILTLTLQNARIRWWLFESKRGGDAHAVTRARCMGAGALPLH